MIVLSLKYQELYCMECYLMEQEQYPKVPFSYKNSALKSVQNSCYLINEFNSNNNTLL